VTLVAAPLIAQAFMASEARSRWKDSTFFAGSTAAAFAAIFWAWHTPALYDATLQNNVVYWTMHATTFAGALAVSLAVFGSSAPVAFLVIFATGLQMSLLGALLTFANVPLFAVHEFTAAAWGLTSLQDQQLGGLLMWVPAGLLLTAYSVVAFGRALQGLDARFLSPLEEDAASRRS
jgi:putative membrane protein